MKIVLFTVQAKLSPTAKEDLFTPKYKDDFSTKAPVFGYSVTEK